MDLVKKIEKRGRKYSPNIEEGIQLRLIQLIIKKGIPETINITPTRIGRLVLFSIKINAKATKIIEAINER